MQCNAIHFIPFQEELDTNEQIYAKHEHEAIIWTIRLKYTMDYFHRFNRYKMYLNAAFIRMFVLICVWINGSSGTFSFCSKLYRMQRQHIYKFKQEMLRDKKMFKTLEHAFGLDSNERTYFIFFCHRNDS